MRAKGLQERKGVKGSDAVTISHITEEAARRLKESRRKEDEGTD